MSNSIGQSYRSGIAYAIPEKTSSEDLLGDETNEAVNNLAMLTLVNEKPQTTSTNTNDDLKYKNIVERSRNQSGIRELKKRYCAYNALYESNNNDEKEHHGHPLLFDALLTGWSDPRTVYDTHRITYYRERIVNEVSSAATYDEMVERDIQDIVELMPTSLYAIMGINFVDMLFFRMTTPLYAACINPVIPLKIVELLLQKGAAPAEELPVHSYICPGPTRASLYGDMEQLKIDAERIEGVRALFARYRSPT